MLRDESSTGVAVSRDTANQRCELFGLHAGDDRCERVHDRGSCRHPVHNAGQYPIENIRVAEAATMKNKSGENYGNTRWN